MSRPRPAGRLRRRRAGSRCPAASRGWRTSAFALEADAARGGTLSRLLDKRTGTELLQAGGRGNQLLLQPEHPQHPRWAEGPWLLCPAGPGTGSAESPARVRAERCPVGSRLVAELELGGLRVTQETLLWDGADRVEFATHVDGSIGQDHLLRVMFPVSVPGGLPVYQTAVSVIGRPPGPVETDVAEHPYTLDSPANEWLAVGSTAAVALPGPDGSRQLQAIGVAEVVVSPALRGPARDLVAALAGQGVTATCSRPDGPRYGYQELDSNLPDFRICVGGPEDNAFTAQVLAAAGPAAAAVVTAHLAAGQGRVWLPASRSRADAFAAGADLRGALDLPVLIVAAADLALAVGELAADLGDAVIEVPHSVIAAPAPGDAAAAGHGAGRPYGRAAEPGHALRTDYPGRRAHHGADARVQHLAVRHLDRRAEADRSGRQQLRLAALESHVRVRDRSRPATGGSPALRPRARITTTICSLCRPACIPGPLPSATFLAQVEPAGALLSALKPRGNPLAPASQPDPADGVTVRLRDIGGSGPAAAQVRLFAGIAAASLGGLCEDTAGDTLPVRDGAAEVLVPRAGLVTMAISPGPAGPGLRPAAPPGGPAGPGTGLPEPAQPVFARYWLHGKGPAPAGNMPVAVHLSPAATSLDDGEPATLQLTVACGPAAASGQIRLAAPAGFSLSPAGPLDYDLPPLGHQRTEVAVTAPPGRPARPLFRHRADRGSGRADDRGQCPAGHRPAAAAAAGPAAGRGRRAAAGCRRRPGRGDRRAADQHERGAGTRRPRRDRGAAAEPGGLGYPG